MVKQEPGLLDAPDHQQANRMELEQAAVDDEGMMDNLLPSKCIPKLSGFIPNQPIPANSAPPYYESVMGGFTLHPSIWEMMIELHSTWKAAAERDQAKWEAITMSRIEHQIQVNEAYRSRCDGSLEAICPASMVITGVARCLNMAGMGTAGEQIPSNIGLLGALPAIESTTKLMGLVASQDLPKGFVLGPLCGYLMPAKFAAMELQDAPMHPDLKCTPERWRFECARYLFDIEASIADPSASGGSSIAQLSVWGMGYGGQGMLINDAVSNPISWCKAANKKAKELESKGLGGTAAAQAEVDKHAETAKTFYDQGNNVEVVVVDVRGMPLPFLVCCRDVPQGSPFYRNYGVNWWQRHGDLRHSALDAEEEAEEAQGHEAAEVAASAAGLSLLSILGNKGISSAFVPPEQQEATALFIDLSVTIPGPDTSCQKGSTLTLKNDEMEKDTELLFGIFKDPGWRAKQRSLVSELEMYISNPARST